MTHRGHLSARFCGFCGRHVRPYRGALKADGWYWHKKCWREFLASRRKPRCANAE